MKKIEKAWAEQLPEHSLDWRVTRSRLTPRQQLWVWQVIERLGAIAIERQQVRQGRRVWVPRSLMSQGSDVSAETEPRQAVLPGVTR